VHAVKEREREEERRIKEPIREEERARCEIEKALRGASKEEETHQKVMEMIQAQAAKATEEQRVQFELRLAELQTKLAEAEAKNQRALSTAQQTRAGHVYITSNIGSFGERMFKVGMTRRLELSDRSREPGDTVVPVRRARHDLVRRRAGARDDPSSRAAAL
jgi:translation elongation factor EF-G